VVVPPSRARNWARSVGLSWSVGSASTPARSSCRREGRLSATVGSEVEERFEGLKKKELVALCRSAGLKVSGTKAELVERLAEAEREAAFEENAVETSAVEDAPVEQQLEELLDAVAAAGANVDPATLAEASDDLLANDGALFDRVASRRLARAPGDQALKGAVALLRGFVSAELKLQARDAVRYVLRTAVEKPHEIDACFKRLGDAGKLNAALASYVDELLRQQVHLRERDSGSLLSKVLTIIKDRIDAEKRADDSDELRTLAEAIRIQDPRQRRKYLQTALAASLDFAQRFEAYMHDAATYVDQNPVSAHLDADAIRDVNILVAEIRAKMPV